MKLFEPTVIFFGWLSSLGIVDASSILAVFPIPMKSRFSFGEAVIRSLYDAGHQITFVSPFLEDERLKNYTIIDASLNSEDLDMSVDYLRTYRTYDCFAVVRQLEEDLCRHVLNNEAIKEMLNSNQKRFDVMFVDLLYMYECYLPLAQKLDIPVIGTVSMRSWKLAEPLFVGGDGRNPSIGNFYNPATVPFEFAALPKTMTFGQRARSTWYYLLAEFFRYFVISPSVRDVYRQYYPAHLWYKKKLSLVFYNNHPTILPKPSVPSAIEIGGLHVKPAKPLPQNIQKFIDESRHGVILFTFGSYISNRNIDPKILNVFKGAFAAIPQRVIWKFEGEVDDLPENVLPMKWVPQRDILAHENVIAFITHCGMSGIYEAIHEGKPLIMVPLIIDQLSNGANLEELGVGLSLDYESLSKDTVLGALNAVVNDTRYRDRMRELSRRFKDRPMTPQQSVVYWTEYVIRHKGALHLRTAAADMPLYQYLLLDIVLLGSLSILLISCITYIATKKVVTFCIRRTKNANKIKEKTS